MEGRASPTAEKKQEYKKLCEAVSHTENLVHVAANNLQPYRHLTGKVRCRYGGAKRYAIRLEDELQYAPAWTFRRQCETRAAYQAFCALRKLLEPFSKMASGPQIPHMLPYTIFYFHHALLEYADCLVGQTRPPPTPSSQERTAKESLQKAASAYQRALAGKSLLLKEGSIAPQELRLRQDRCEELKKELTEQARQSDAVLVAGLLLQELGRRERIVKKQEQDQANPGEQTLAIPEALALSPEKGEQVRQAELHGLSTVIALLRQFYIPSNVSHFQVYSLLWPPSS